MRTLGKRVKRNLSWVRIPPSPQNEISARESDEEWRAEGVQDEEKGRKRHRVAKKAEGNGTAKCANLFRTRGLVPIFWTKGADCLQVRGVGQKIGLFCI